MATKAKKEDEFISAEDALFGEIPMAQELEEEEKQPE